MSGVRLEQPQDRHGGDRNGPPSSPRADVHKLQIRRRMRVPSRVHLSAMQDLRGFEELMVDFGEEPPELQMLIDKVLAYNLRQGDLLLKALERVVPDRS